MVKVVGLVLALGAQLSIGKEGAFLQRGFRHTRGGRKRCGLQCEGSAAGANDVIKMLSYISIGRGVCSTVDGGWCLVFRARVIIGMAV